jgi:membrane-bound serine protease (ClpP class)
MKGHIQAIAAIVITLGLIVFNASVFAENEEASGGNDQAVTDSTADDKKVITIDPATDSAASVNTDHETEIANGLSDDASDKTDDETNAVAHSTEENNQEMVSHEEIESAASTEDSFHNVYVIPIEGVISKPIHFILRRSLKEAIDNDIDVVVLDMNTPGGRVDITLEIMDMLDRFEGDTITYVNVDATSAGAFIAASTKEIYFAPKGQIGAAAPIMAGGAEIPETAKLKVMSHLRAKIRSYTGEYPYRAEVIRAMMDETFVLEIDDKVIKPEGELLSLTAREAIAEYGDPPRPLLGAGIADSLEAMLNTKYGVGNHKIKTFEITWSESLAQYLDMIKPVLMGLGILCLIIEFKTPNFGVIGGIGIGMLLVVFISNYVAGLAGQEAILLFILGLILIAVELFVFPGMVIPALAGLALVLGSLIWSLADVWPGNTFDLNPEIFWPPVYQLALSIFIAILGAILIWRFLPKSWVWDKLTLSGGVAAPNPLTAGGGSSLESEGGLPQVGSHGVAFTDLHPAGQVDIDGRRFEGTLGFGTLDRGESVQVIGHQNFALKVRKIDT